MFKKIAIAADHNGDEYITYVKDALTKAGIEYVVPSYKSEAANDYPDIYAEVYKLFTSGEIDGMILLCGTGVGMCMCANKSRGVRCVWANNKAVAVYGRVHENANALALGVGYQDPKIGLKVSLSKKQIKSVVASFVKTPFSEAARHIRRVEKLENLM